MILKVKIPAAVREQINEANDDRVYYALPVDINRESKYAENSYLVVTTKRILLFEEGTLAGTLLISECGNATATARVGQGMLTLEHNGKLVLLCRFSHGLIAKYAYIARGINILASGRFEEVESNEYEPSCPICGRAIPGTSKCPHCSGEGGIIKTVRRLARPYHRNLFGIAILMILASVTTLLNPEIQKHLVDKVLMEESPSKSAAFLCLGGMFALSLGIVFVNVAKSYYSTKLGARMSHDLRGELFDKLQATPLSYINDRRPGELLNRVISDTRVIREFMENVFCNLFTVAFIFVCDIVFMIVLNPGLALLTFVPAPFAIAMLLAFRKSINRRFHLQWVKNDDQSSNLQDVLSGMRVVKSFGNEKSESEKFLKLSNEYARVQMSNESFWAVFNPIIGTVLGLGLLVVVFFGGKEVLEGEMTAGELLQFMTYTTLLYQYINWMANFPRALMRLKSSVERISDVLSYNIKEKASGEVLDISGEVVFDHTTFGYKSYKPVLEGIELTVRPGEKIGIVGPSGAGKSTLINLLMGLYEADDGVLLIDGRDIRTLDRKSFHSQLGVVLQETFLFSGTILENIRFARPDASMNEIIAAAKVANAHDFICKTPGGYDTYVGEKGYSLSGGERQRIAIARAVLADPKLLILDEATASLDTESEYLVQTALSALTKNKTTFAIAHRLSTLKDCDRLIVIDGHRIAECGSHDELIAAGGLYYELLTAQLQMQKA
ncbi:MAG: ABC transporter ATP-binding protein/permease [Lachnospiraceae bacterium]|nr:ABC transporter ATP-binding protein/permease [Lachnospiraceae bacterium]